MAFTGDTLFSVGCGRVIEGTHAQMWHSLEKIAALPASTLIYCGHEYTQSNIRFALTVEPGNRALAARKAEVDALRAEGKPTLPVSLAKELETNPFLRPKSPEIRSNLDKAVVRRVKVRDPRRLAAAPARRREGHEPGGGAET